MNILDFLYEQDFKKINFLDRKVSVNSPKTFIYGTNKSGKSYLIYDYLNRFSKKEVLYIDFNDERVNKEEIKKNLYSFIKSKNIKVLALDNFDFSFEIPNISNIVISSNKDREIKNFKKIHLFPLDFEEFISFYKKYSHPQAMFNIYAKVGTYPKNVLHSKDFLYQNIQEMLKISLTKEEFLIFKQFAISQGKKKSLFQIFNEIKKENKISKDLFYKTVNDLKDRDFIFLVEKFNQPRAYKKIHLIDFTLKSAFSFQKDFMKMFENMIFLELIKRGYDLSYTDSIELLSSKNKSAFLAMPFLPLEIIKTKLNILKKEFKKLQIEKVYVITLEYEEEFINEDIKYEIKTFWNFASNI